MEIACPVCLSEVNAAEDEHCPQCGCAVRILRDILYSAEDSVLLAMEALRNSHNQDALDYAYEAWGLRNSPETAAMGLIAAMRLRDGTEVHRWLKRRRKTAAD